MLNSADKNLGPLLCITTGEKTKQFHILYVVTLQQSKRNPKDKYNGKHKSEEM